MPFSHLKTVGWLTLQAFAITVWLPQIFTAVFTPLFTSIPFVIEVIKIIIAEVIVVNS
nr:MAG TPA: hypothetical protein [Caudoviricetes sp.]